MYLLMTFAFYRFDLAATNNCRIVVVVKGDPPLGDAMPVGLKDYIQSNTYLKWDDARFWSKLRYALPHNDPECFCFVKRRKVRQDQLPLEPMENGTRIKKNGVSPLNV